MYNWLYFTIISSAGVAFAEGFVVKQPVVRPHLLSEWSAR